MSGQRRMEQLIFMYQCITGEDNESIENKILETETGQAILKNDPSVMYEQQTDNLYRIVSELMEDPEGAGFTSENIVNAMKKLNDLKDPETLEIKLEKIKEQDNLRKSDKHKMIEKQSSILKDKRKNMINIGRIKHAIDSQG